jgi:hypothetical protein
MLRANRAIAVIFVVIGTVILVETTVLTVRDGGGLSVGFLLAAVFLVLGVLRWRAMRPPQ